VNKRQKFYHDEAPKKRRNKTNSALHKFQNGISNKSKEIDTVLYLEIWNFEPAKYWKRALYFVIHNKTVAEPFVMVSKAPPPPAEKYCQPCRWWDSHIDKIGLRSGGTVAGSKQHLQLSPWWNAAFWICGAGQVGSSTLRMFRVWALIGVLVSHLNFFSPSFLHRVRRKWRDGKSNFCAGLEKKGPYFHVTSSSTAPILK
jgi:hypothetical protein